MGRQRLRALLDTGDRQALARIKLGEQYTVAETLKFLRKVPPLSVLKLLDRIRADEVRFSSGEGVGRARFYSIGH